MVPAGFVVIKDLEPWAIYADNRKLSTINRDAVMGNYLKFLADRAE